MVQCLCVSLVSTQERRKGLMQAFPRAHVSSGCHGCMFWSEKYISSISNKNAYKREHCSVTVRSHSLSLSFCLSLSLYLSLSLSLSPTSLRKHPLVPHMLIQPSLGYLDFLEARSQLERNRCTLKIQARDGCGS